MNQWAVLAGRAWLAIVLLAGLDVGVRLWKGPFAETNILALFPESERDPFLQSASEIAGERFGRTLAFLISNPDPESLEESGNELVGRLQKSGLFSEVFAKVGRDNARAFADFYFPRRYELLSPEDRLALDHPDGAHVLLNRTMALLAGPMGPALSPLLRKDPLLFFPRLIKSWAWSMGEGGGAGPPESRRLIQAELAGNPMTTPIQERIASLIESLRREWSGKRGGTRLDVAGLALFARAERQRLQQTIQQVTLISLVGILLLVTWFFRSLRPFLLTVAALGAGTMVACAVSVRVFGSVHAATLAFGSSLLGVAVDYALHYFSHQATSLGERPMETVAAVRPGILMGSLTSVIGYAALALSGFPGLRQIAVFSCVGLAATVVSVFLWFPHWTIPKRTRRGNGFLRFWESIRTWGWKSGVRRWALIGFLGVLLAGVARVHFDDDVRRLRSEDADLLAQENRIRSQGGDLDIGRYLFIQGSSQEEILTRQEHLEVRLGQMKQEGMLKSFLTLAPFLPSDQRRLETRKRLADLLSREGETIRQSLRSWGVPRKAIQSFFADARESAPDPFPMEKWQSSPVSQGLKTLWLGNLPEGMGSMALLGGVKDENTLCREVANLPGVTYFDKLGGFSELLGRYRHRALFLGCFVYIAIFLIVAARFGLKSGIRVTAPCLLSAAVVMGVLGWTGTPVSFIHVLSVILVMAMGIDYSIIFEEMRRSRLAPSGAVWGVTLAAATTIISFAALAFSKAPLLKAVGATVAVGITCSYLFATVFSQPPHD